MPVSDTHLSLLNRLGRGIDPESLALADLIESIFTPRLIPVPGATLLLGNGSKGAVYRMAGACTVTIPTSLDIGFLCSFLQYSSTAMTFTTPGTLLGGTSSGGQNKVTSLWRLDTGEFLLIGGA